MPRPLVPALVAQPFLEVAQADLWVTALQFRNIGFEAGIVEPAEHLVKLFAEKEPHDRHRQLMKFHLFAGDAAEHLRGLDIRELAPCDLNFSPEEPLGAQKRERNKPAD